MDKDIETRALEALERQKKQYARQNEYIKGAFDRISVTLPKGTKDRIKAANVGSINGYINALVENDLKQRGV